MGKKMRRPLRKAGERIKPINRPPEGTKPSPGGRTIMRPQPPRDRGFYQGVRPIMK